MLSLRTLDPSPVVGLFALVLTYLPLLAVPTGAMSSDEAASQVGNQIRLNRPGGGEQPSLPPGGGGGSAGGGSGPSTMNDISPEESLRIFQNAGFDSVRIVQDEKSGDYLRLRSDNRDSFVFHMNCKDGRCRSLMFTAFLTPKRGASLNFVNGYNLKTLHTKMSRNDAGEIVLTMAAGLTGGVTAEYLRRLGPFWDQVHRDALAWK